MKETKVSTTKRWWKGLDSDLGNEMPTLQVCLCLYLTKYQTVFLFNSPGYSYAHYSPSNNDCPSLYCKIK
jgi:hypothetical protein